mmetsp:Transcript_12523/g.27654  ORF Transcript_12523/g.27654 Transcript_12523/m.27654 type:complete len:444 (-) Transcript_12523:158-1489(-)
MLNHLNRTIYQIGLVVSHAPFLAKAHDKFVHRPQMVTGNLGKQMVLHLVLKSAAEPVHESLGNSVSAGDVAGGGHLKLPKVGTLVRIIRGHAVVAKPKDEGQEESARAGGSEEKTNGFGQAKSAEPGAKRRHPDIMEDDAAFLQYGILQTLGLQFQGRVGTGRSQTERRLKRFPQPRKPRQEKNGKVKEDLKFDHETHEGRVGSRLGQFPVGLRLLQRPRQHGHGIDVRISVLGQCRRAVQVWYRVMGVVFVLPPLHGVSLHQIAPVNSGQISEFTVFEHLVVKVVMCQPTALLEEKSHHKSGADVRGGRFGVKGQSHGRGPDGHVREKFVDVEQLGAFEKTKFDELDAQVAVSFLEGDLAVGFVHVALDDELPDEEVFHGGLGARSVHGGENVGHVVSSVSENDGSAGVIVPVRDIVDFVVIDHPRIFRDGVLFHFIPSVFL